MHRAFGEDDGMTIDRLVNWFLAGCIAVAAGMFIGGMLAMGFP